MPLLTPWQRFAGVDLMASKLDKVIADSERLRSEMSRMGEQLETFSDDLLVVVQLLRSEIENNSGGNDDDEGT